MRNLYLICLLVFSYSLIQAQSKNADTPSTIKNLEKQKQEAVANGDYTLAYELKQEIEKLATIKALEKQISEAVDKQEFVLAASLKKELDKERGAPIARPAVATSTAATTTDAPAAGSATQPAKFIAGKSTPLEAQELKRGKKGKRTNLIFRSSMDIKDESGKLVGKQINLGTARPWEDDTRLNVTESEFSSRMTDDFKYLILKAKGRILTFDNQGHKLIDSRETGAPLTYPSLVDDKGGVKKVVGDRIDGLWSLLRYSNISYVENIGITAIPHLNTNDWRLGVYEEGYKVLDYNNIADEANYADQRKKVEYKLRLRDALSRYKQDIADWRSLPDDVVNISADMIPLTRYADHVSGEVSIAEEYTDMLNPEMKSRKVNYEQIIAEPNGNFAYILTDLSLYPQVKKFCPYDNPMDNNSS